MSAHRRIGRREFAIIAVSSTLTIFIAILFVPSDRPVAIAQEPAPAAESNEPPMFEALALESDDPAAIVQNPQEIAKAQTYLQRFGYLGAEQDPVAADDTPTPFTAYSAVLGDVGHIAAPDEPGQMDWQTERALRVFQLHANLTISGQLDAPTVAKMNEPRCGLPDFAEFVVSGRDWVAEHPDGKMSYRFENMTAQLSQSEVRDAFRRAFEMWEAVAPLRFEERSSGDVDIVILFAKAVHGNNVGESMFEAFDGQGGTLAHAYFPPPLALAVPSIAGDAHFDDDEVWVVAAPGAAAANGTDLVTVAAHELGHALGLGHEPATDAIMNPFYNGPRQLSADDVQGIQAIYGSPP